MDASKQAIKLKKRSGILPLPDLTLKVTSID
jgi:hypothetical protein